MGRTYGGQRIYADGAFKGKRAMLTLTTGGPAAAYADRLKNIAAEPPFDVGIY